ncbi:MAG: hypothetical protein JO336_08150, partial [Acidobacteriia bacterium]|nr:hypothetical protein [Terriglobia bacterium]
RAMHLSRSALFAVAIEEYLHRRRNAEITEKLNLAYGSEEDIEEQRRMAKLMKAKFRSTIKDKW